MNRRHFLKGVLIAALAAPPLIRDIVEPKFYLFGVRLYPVSAVLPEINESKPLGPPINPVLYRTLIN